MMRNLLFLPLLLVMAIMATAQNAAMHYSNRQAQFSYFSKESCNTSDPSQLRIFLEKRLGCELTLVQTTGNEYSINYTFTQRKNGVEVYHGFAKANLAANASSFQVLHDIFRDIPDQRINTPNACWYLHEGAWIVAIKQNKFIPEKHSLFEVITDEQEHVIAETDLALYSVHKDSVVRVKVFNPDPLTTAHTTYGAPFLDYNDSDVTTINNQRVWKHVICEFKNDTFWMKNKFLTPFKNPGGHYYDPVYRKDTLFDYTRRQREFEDVMVMYHITAYQGYLSSVGYTNIGYRPTPYDAHGAKDDNSMFLPGVGLIFGTGAIDDAEDGTVIIHEYAHSLRESVATGTNTGAERQAVEEGYCDYFATSNKMIIDSFGWKKFAYWDGNNPGPPAWLGRDVASEKIYPQALTSDIYTNGEIWSSALMRIYFKLGKTITDRICLQSLYDLTGSLSMPQVALLVIKADSTLYSGVHAELIWRTFAETHILPWYNGMNNKTVASESLRFINTQNFMEGKGDLSVVLPSFESGSYAITNNLGQVIRQEAFTGDHFTLKGGLIETPGVYYLTVNSPAFRSVRKLIIQ